ncbi:hypothetical protein ABZ532_17735, partial [Streptomyces sp. NPDC019396]
MSEAQVTTALSRHWKLAVLAAAGFATVAATTTFAAVSHRETVAGAQAAAAAADGKGLPAGGGGKGDEGKGDHDKGGHDKGGHDKGGHDKGGHDKGGHDKGGRSGHGEDDEYGGRHGGDDAIKVECDPNELIAALVDLNADTGGTLVLAKDCTYTLTANEDENGLPEIT